MCPFSNAVASVRRASTARTGMTLVAVFAALVLASVMASADLRSAPAPAQASAATPAAAAAAWSYWESRHESGFRPGAKYPDACLAPSLRPLCDALASNPGSTEELAKAATVIDLPAILESSEEAIEDAHHYLAITACRVGVNTNPEGKGPHDATLPTYIPYSIGAPLLTLSAHLHREPAIGYAGLVLDNCVRAAASRGRGSRPSPSDWKVQRTVTSSADGPAHEFEQGFYAGHCAVEHDFGMTKLALEAATRTAETMTGPKAASHLADNLRDVAFNIRQMVPQLKNMRNYIAPRDFLLKLRSFIKCGCSFEHGLVFAGPDSASPVTITFPDGSARVVEFNTMYKGDGQGFRGPTGAMTTTLSFVDATLGITSSFSADPSLQLTMEDFKRFQPSLHSSQVAAIADTAAIRSFVEECHQLAAQGDDQAEDRLGCRHSGILDAYNDAVTAVVETRFAHVDHIDTFILDILPPFLSYAEVTGSGGTPVVAYLCRAAIGTAAARLKTPGNPALSAVGSLSIPSVCHTQCDLDQQLTEEDSLCSSITKVDTQMRLPTQAQLHAQDAAQRHATTAGDQDTAQHHATTAGEQDTGLHHATTAGDQDHAQSHANAAGDQDAAQHHATTAGEQDTAQSHANTAGDQNTAQSHANAGGDQDTAQAE